MEIVAGDQVYVVRTVEYILVEEHDVFRCQKLINVECHTWLQVAFALSNY